MTTHTLFLAGEFNGKTKLEATVHGVAEMDMTEQLMLSVPNYF